MRPKGIDMSKTRRWVIILLSLVALILIGVNLADRDDTQTEVISNNDQPIKAITVIP